MKIGEESMRIWTFNIFLISLFAGLFSQYPGLPHIFSL